MPRSASELIRWARDCHIQPDARQSVLTRRLLWPVRHQVLAKARACRAAVDARFRERPPAAAPYPIGCCLPIRNAVWDALSADPLIRQLIRQGLTWRRVYFISCGRYFQNAIQLGDCILDAAHDTVDLRDASVVLSRLDETEYENIDDWGRYGEIAESYHQLRLYPNRHFPLLFPLAPFLAVRASGRLDLPLYQSLLFLLDLGDGWTRARRLLSQSEWMNRRLPREYEGLLEDWRTNGAGRDLAVEFQRCDLDALAQTLDDWEAVRALPAPQQAATIENFSHLADHTARLLRKANLCPAPETLDELRRAGYVPTIPSGAASSDELPVRP